MEHSSIIGGSTAKRVRNCPGSVALCAKMPPKGSSSYADEGTLCHNCMDNILGENQMPPESVIGMEYKGIKMTQDLFDAKIAPALTMFEAICEEYDLEYQTETRVGYTTIPDAFGTTDITGFSHTLKRSVFLDWKFGDGVPVPVENNDQMLFYSGAARETKATDWVFEESEGGIAIIIQPTVVPAPQVWPFPFAYLDMWVAETRRAVKAAMAPGAPLALGDWCKWCAAKPICPAMTGEIERTVKGQFDKLDKALVGSMLDKVALLKEWISGVESLAFDALNAGQPIPGYKLVAKRATRQWVNAAGTIAALEGIGVPKSEVMTVPELMSPAQVEKVLKKRKLALPEGTTVAISSGNTIAPEGDPRPAVILLGQQMQAALSKLV